MSRLSSVGLSIRGDQDIKKILDEIAPQESKNLMRTTVYAIAARITKGAKLRLKAYNPSWRVIKTIHTKREKSPPDAPVSTVRFDPSGYYWRFIESGTTKRNNLSARPFLMPARDEVVNNLSTIMREEFQKKFEKRIKAVLKKQAGQNR